MDITPYARLQQQKVYNMHVNKSICTSLMQKNTLVFIYEELYIL